MELYGPASGWPWCFNLQIRLFLSKDPGYQPVINVFLFLMLPLFQMSASALSPWLQQGNFDPSAPCLLSTSGLALSRRQLQEAVQATMVHLRLLGIRPEHRLTLLMAPGPAMAGSLLAAMAFAAVAPLVPTSPVGALVEDLLRLRITHVLVDGQPPTALLSAAAQLALPVIPLNPFQLPEPGVDPVDPPTASSLALLLQTSGTTSRPKVVPLSHANFLASARAVADGLALGSGDRSLAAMPLFHRHGIVASLVAPCSRVAA